MEDQVILQMDQTTLEDQSILWQLRKRSICSDLDCCMPVFASRHRKEALAVVRIVIYDIAGSGILHFR